MFRFAASFAANVGARDLDSISYTHLPRTSDLLLILRRHRDRGKAIWAVATTLLTGNGGSWKTLFALTGLAPELGYQAQRLIVFFFFLLMVNISGPGGYTVFFGTTHLCLCSVKAAMDGVWIWI